MIQLRIVGLGDYDNYLSYFTYSIMEGAIRCGHLFRPVPFFGHPLDDIKRQILWFKPHILLTHMIFGCSEHHNQSRVLDMLRDMRKRDIFVVYHNGDARKDPRYYHDISDYVDLGLLNQSNLNHYENIWKITCIQWPYMCLYQEEIQKPTELYKCEMAFTGGLASTGVHKERTRFIQELSRAGLNIKVFPTLETGNTRFQTGELAASAGAVLGVQMERNLAGYLDVRPYQYIGAGALYFHDQCKQMHMDFIPGVHYVEYKRGDVEEVIRLFGYLKKNPEEARSIRENGFRHCQWNHSTKNRMESILEKYWEMR